MNLKSLFSLQTVVSCLIALALYDLVVKGLIASFSKYDDTLDSFENKTSRLENRVSGKKLYA